jgi:regulator of RNase E activity RraA
MSASIQCRFPSLGPVVGYAVTAKIRSGRYEDSPNDLRRELWEHTQSVPAPRLVVIEDCDPLPGRGSFWGEVNANIFRALGCLGVVTDGSVRDLPEMEAAGFFAFSGSVSVSHAYARVVCVGSDVEVGGLRVEPGDLLHGDMHGVVSIPKHTVNRLIDEVRAVELHEREIIDLCNSSEFSLARLLGLLEVRH